MYARTVESIKEHGFIDPVTVRSTPNHGIQIIDGEHRWKAAIDLGIETIPVVDLGPISDHAAQKLTILTNELRGTANQQKLSVLLKDLAGSESIESLINTLPFTADSLQGMIGLDGFQWPDSLKPEAKQTGEKKEGFVERTYRLPKSAAAVLDEAIVKAKDGEDMSDVQALELIAADFLAG